MHRDELAKLLSKKVLILDGAMGTVLMENGTSIPEVTLLKNPELIKSIHQDYYKAGADIIMTCSFGANRTKLKHSGMEKKVIEINRKAVTLARQSAPGSLIMGELGPLSNYLEPFSEITFDEAYEIYSEQVKGLKEAELIGILTISDIKMLKAAILAVKDNCELPILASMTFQNGRTSTGTDIETFAVIADALDVDVIGANCSEGLERMYEVAKLMRENTNKPIAVKPNAGIPKIIDKKTIYSETPEQFAEFAVKFHNLGINLIGACCGSTPAHIKAIAEKIKGKAPIQKQIGEKTKLCSRLKTITIEGKTIIVGERINPTGKKEFQEEIKQGKTTMIRNLALEQVEQGAALLDINVGVAGVDEAKALPKAVETIQNLVDAPLVLDTSNLVALGQALKKCDGKPLINSVNASEKSLNQVLPLAKRYGAAVIALTLDESALPDTKEKRISIAKKIISRAEKVGIKKHDIIVDSLVLSLATNPENENIVLESLKEIKSLGYKTILGISNISHGLPNRSEINSKFLTKASKAGLDLAIINPMDNVVQENTELEIFKPKKITGEEYKNLSLEKKIYNAVVYGDEDNILELVNEALKKFQPREVNDILIEALSEVGDKFNCKNFFLPQVLASAGAVKRAFTRLKKEFKKEEGKEKGIVVFATVENDIHDIGKNIVIALLESHNYKVIDLGISVPKEKILEAVKKYRPGILALSALMTTTALEMDNVIKTLRENNIKIPVIIGGAVITEEFSTQIHAKYSKDAISAVKKVNEIIKCHDKKNH